MHAVHRMRGAGRGCCIEFYELDIALGTEMRKGERYDLRGRNVDFKQKIALRDTKDKSSRTLPMIKDVVKSFVELRKLSRKKGSSS
jgi:integrase